jgi:hypothetical protein
MRGGVCGWWSRCVGLLGVPAAAWRGPGPHTSKLQATQVYPLHPSKGALGQCPRAAPSSASAGPERAYGTVRCRSRYPYSVACRPSLHLRMYVPGTWHMPRSLILCYHQRACGGVRLALLRRLVQKAELVGLASRRAPLAAKAPPRTYAALPGLRCARVSDGHSPIRQPSHAVHGRVLSAICSFAACGTRLGMSCPNRNTPRSPSVPRIRALQRFKQAARCGFQRRRRTYIGSAGHNIVCPPGWGDDRKAALLRRDLHRRSCR